MNSSSYEMSSSADSTVVRASSDSGTKWLLPFLDLSLGNSHAALPVAWSSESSARLIPATSLDRQPVSRANLKASPTRLVTGGRTALRQNWRISSSESIRVYAV